MPVIFAGNQWYVVYLKLGLLNIVERSSRFLYVIFKICCQLLGALPQTPTGPPGLCPWTRWGNIRPPNPLIILSILLVCSSLKKILRAPMI